LFSNGNRGRGRKPWVRGRKTRETNKNKRRGTDDQVRKFVSRNNVKLQDKFSPKDPEDYERWVPPPRPHKGTNGNVVTYNVEAGDSKKLCIAKKKTLALKKNMLKTSMAARCWDND